MQLPQTMPEEKFARPQGLGLWIRLLALDYVVLAAQASVLGHLQTSLFTCHLAPLIAILVGFRLGSAVGAIHGLWLGWASGALMAEPTGIPMAVTWAVGGLAGLAREGFRLEVRGIRLWLALSLLVVGEVLATLLTLVIWQRLPAVLPLSLIVYAALAPIADVIVDWFMPEL